MAARVIDMRRATMQLIHEFVMHVDGDADAHVLEWWFHRHARVPLTEV